MRGDEAALLPRSNASASAGDFSEQTISSRIAAIARRAIMVAAILALLIYFLEGSGAKQDRPVHHLHPRESFPSRTGGPVDHEAVLKRWTAHHDRHLKRRSFNWFGFVKRDPEEERLHALRQAYADRAKEMMAMVLETNHGPSARKQRQINNNPNSAIATKASVVLIGATAPASGSAMATPTMTATATATVSATFWKWTYTSTATALPPAPRPAPPGKFRNDFKDHYIYNPNTIRDPALEKVPFASWNLTDALRRNYTCELDYELEDFENREKFEGNNTNKLGGLNGGGGMVLHYINGTTSFAGTLMDETGLTTEIRGYFIRLINDANVLIDPSTHGLYRIDSDGAQSRSSNDSYGNYVKWESQLVWINLNQGRFDAITQNGSIVPFYEWDQAQFNHTILPINMTHATIAGTVQDVRTLNSTPRAFTSTVSLNASYNNDGMFYFMPKTSESWWSTSFPECRKSDRFGFLEFDMEGPPTTFGIGITGCNATKNGTEADDTLWLTVQHTEFRQHHRVPLAAFLAANMPANSIMVCSPLNPDLARSYAGAAVVSPLLSADWGPILSRYTFVDEDSMLQRAPLFINPALLSNPQLLLSEKAFGNCSIFTPPAVPPVMPFNNATNSTRLIDYEPYSFAIRNMKTVTFSGFQNTDKGNFFYALDNITVASGQFCKPSCPNKGRFHYGVSINWWDDDPVMYIDRVGDRVRPTFWNMYTYVDYNETGGPFFASWNVIGAADRLIQLKYGPIILGVVIMPNAGLQAMSDDVINDIADVCKIINNKGVYVQLIFGHEANGWWYPYGAKPTQYKDAWSRLSAAVKARTSFTRTIWAMNEAHSYPFGNTEFDPVLDTNSNGQIDPGDDPYTPYYAGDAAHDWVGLSLYHLGNFFPWGDVNEEAMPNKVIALIEGSVGYDARPETANNFNFYDMFSVKRGKQLAITETSATFYPDAPGVSRRAVQRSWWIQLFDRITHVERFPMLRMIAWFEWAKMEDNQWKDWKLTDDPETVEVLMSDLPHDLIVKDYELTESCFF